MVNYIIRATFLSPEADSYRRLAVELAKYQIAAAIKGDEGVAYYLPDGEFCYSGNEPINEVRDAVHRLAHTIHTEVSVVVTEVTTIAWSGLKPVEAELAAGL